MLDFKMRFFCFILLIILLTSCTQEKIKIKTSDIEEPLIKTTIIEANGEVKKEIKEPQINILNPKDGEVINSSTIIVRLNISNFKLITPDRYPKEGQGHIQVWVDNMEYRSSKTEFIFENESNGTHLIKAELMLSNNTVLPYSKTIKVFVNKP